MNKKLLLTLFVFLGFSFHASAQSYGELFESEVAASMRTMAAKLQGADETAAADIVRARFQADGLDVLGSADDNNFGILSPSGDTIICHNAIAFIQGYDRKLKDNYIVIGAPIKDNVSGLTALMRLGKMLQTNSVLLRRSVLLAAFGAAELQNAGSWYFLNRSFGSDAARVDAMMDLSFLGQGSRGFYAYTASNADLNQTVNNLANTLQPLHPKIIAAEPAISDHRSFYAKQIPSIQFISGPIPKAGAISENIEFDYLERETEYLYNFAVALANGPAPSFSPTDIERPERATEVVSWSDCDVKPAFMNNPNPSVFLERWVYVYLKYPQYAIDNGIQGKVLVDFVIDEKGKVKDVKVLKGVHPSLDDEAVKVVSASPDWKPARVRGKKVPCAISLYVEFRLKKK